MITSLPSVKYQIDSLLQPISSKEVVNAIKKLHTGKAPGSDGLTVDFYKHFSAEISPILATVFNEAMENKTVKFIEIGNNYTVIQERRSS